MSSIKWAVDPLHSELHFKVKHLVISTVTGTFKTFNGEVETPGEIFEGAAVKFEIDVASVDTNQPHRDEHLKNSDFFEAATYPKITFVSNSFKKVKGDDFKLTGDLTLRGVTKPVELDVEYGGSEKDQYGNVKHGFEVRGKINRKEFGMTFNSLTETGGLALGEEVKLTANIQLSKVA